MKLIMSIKPEYIIKIFNGTKKYEFRKFKIKDEITKIIIYATTPISKVVGEFEIEKILYHDIEKLWEVTKDYSGTTKDFFMKYYSKRKKGSAIKIKNPIEYDKYYRIFERYKVKPPRSFVYLTNDK